ncbi:MAG: hypothetical protein HYT94_04205 [Parcubacteria group bacterium]|nr:hypothetical protein [Parcubacteria group bacterium]
MISKNETVVYKPTKKILKDGLFLVAMIFFGLTLPLIIKGETVGTQKLMGLAGFWLFGIILTVVPLGARLEVGEDYIKTYLFGFTTTHKIYRSDIQVLEYGNLFRFGGLGYGKGIKFRALINGKSKAYSIGEYLYGKEAIAHAKRVLEAHLITEKVK